MVHYGLRLALLLLPCLLPSSASRYPPFTFHSSLPRYPFTTILPTTSTTSTTNRQHPNRRANPPSPPPHLARLSSLPFLGRGGGRGGGGGDWKRALDLEFLAIAAPAFIQFTAEPLAGLVDTAYLGRLGATALGGVGVAISAQYSVSKLYNDPLLRTSISLVASTATGDEAPSHSISTALLLALFVGLIQGAVYTLAAAPIIRAMGVGPTSPMYTPAVSYLRVRALATPAATLWLVTNGIFRGLGDTLTPLKWSLVFSALNAILDPIFMFALGMGASGAAAGTAIAQYTALIPLLLKVRKVAKIEFHLRDLWPSLRQYLSAATMVFVRTWAKILAYAYCARQAALLGVIASAAYNMTFQIGFATTQLCESIAIACQSLIAREMGKLSRPDLQGLNLTRERLWHLIWLGCGLGALVSGGLSLVTQCTRSTVLAGLTSDEAVRAACRSCFGMVMACQVNKGLAYPVNGIIMGGLDWTFSTLIMWVANVVGVAWVAANKPTTLTSIWTGLALFMAVQWVSGAVRFMSGTGVWRQLRGDGTQAEKKKGFRIRRK